MRKSVQWIITVFALALAAGLATLLVRHVMAERQREAAVAEMLEQAEPIEREIEQLRRELAERERNVADVDTNAYLAVGYQITQRSDVELALRHAEQFGFTPVFVLDPTLDSWRDLLDALQDTACEVVVSVSPCTAEGAAALELRSALEAGDDSVKDTGCFLLRMPDDSPENLNVVADAGYTGCIRHADAGENTVLESGLVTLSYSQIKSGEFSVENRLQKAADAAQTLLFVFDMDAVREGALTEADITHALELITAAWTESGVGPGTVTGAETSVRARAETSAVTGASFEEYTAETRERIAQLEAELDAIYAQWNKGDTP